MIIMTTNEKLYITYGAYFYFVDKFLAIFNPTSPLVDKHRYLGHPGKNYVDIWQTLSLQIEEICFFIKIIHL